MPGLVRSLSLLLCLSQAQPAQCGEPWPAQAHELGEHIRLVQLRHSDEGLRKTYLDRRGRRKDGMLLPRIIAFDELGRLLGGQVGFKTGDMRGLPRVAHSGRPIANASGIGDVLGELEMADGQAVERDDLPPGDLYIVVYRAGDCGRCDKLDNELHRVIRRMRRHAIVLIEVDSDPRRL